MNIIESGDGNELVCVNYSNLLEKILKVLRSQKPFSLSSDRHHLLIDVDAVASQIAGLPVDNPLAAASNVRAATVNLSPGAKERFPGQIQEIRKCLQDSLESTLNQPDRNTSIKEFVASLVTDLQTFRGDTPKLDFTYPFGKHNLQKQRVETHHGTSSQSSSSSRELLKLHKLTITVQNTHDFSTQLRQGIENYIELHAGSSDEREDLGYVLEDLQQNSQSDFYRLRQVIDTEALGKLKKEAQICYLEFLKSNINSNVGTADFGGAVYLQDLIRRLRLVNQYIGDVEKADGHYLVNYAGTSVNYRDLFSRADAFDILPIIPKIEGYLGETTNKERGEIQFIFGLKLKFNNSVPAQGAKTVFDYYLNLINPDSEEHQEKVAVSSQSFTVKVLKIAFLYYFIFASRHNPLAPDYTPLSELIYDPVPAFEDKVLPILRGSDDAAKRHLFGNIKKGLEQYNIKLKLDSLKQQLEKVLEQKTALRTREYPLHISVKVGLLEQELSKIFNNGTFFKSALRENPKDVLKYISVSEVNAEANSLCTLAAKITIDDIRYCSTDDQQSFSMEYDVAGIRALPVLFLPLKQNTCNAIYQRNFLQRRLIAFPYSLESNSLPDHQAFVYRFTFALLAYICLNILLVCADRLFIPILRLHLSNRQDDAPTEKFMVSLSKVLSHLLNEEHRSNAQGIDIRDLKHKIPNALSSLYFVLPKIFRFTRVPDSPQLDKLAIIIVSSRESDGKWGSRQKTSNLMGEIVGVRCVEDGAIKLHLLKTFSDNYEHQRMFKDPTVVIDEVSQLYHRGYRHFVYIAKAPYSSTLHMTQKDDEDELFFMSRDVISNLKAEHDDIKIYPMFFDKYYVVKLERLGVSSLYIQDTLELTNLVTDPSKQSAVFFNLFNGVKVGKDEGRHYRGVVSYSTLLNIYKGILDDEDIRTGLIYDTALKTDILHYLTLFHFSRYEKAREISLKLDPYENLIGEYSVGALSLFNHMRGRGNFNLLAFLTEVKKVLNV